MREGYGENEGGVALWGNSTELSEGSPHSDKQLLVLKVYSDQGLECGPWPRKQSQAEAMRERGSLEEALNRKEPDSSVKYKLDLPH